MNDNYLINGKESVALDPFDRGLAFGDGIFRTFKVSDGNPLHWDYQFNKLLHDANFLGIDPPKEELLLNDIKILFEPCGIFIAKFIITRGSSNRGYSTPLNIEANRILLKSNYLPLKNDLYEQGVILEFSTIKVSSNLKLDAIKHLNRLENVLAKQALSSVAFDAIMLDDNSLINECISHNILMRCGNDLFIPKQNKAGVSGVSTQIIINYIKELGFTVNERDINEEQLLKADEIVIMNSVNGALPVKQIKDKKWNTVNLAYEINQLFKKIK